MPRAPRSPRLQAELDRITVERSESEKQANRIYRREMVRACAECFAWCLVGLVIMAVGFHVHDENSGKAWMYGGMIVGNAGVLYSCYMAYRRGEDRGDW